MSSSLPAYLVGSHMEALSLPSSWIGAGARAGGLAVLGSHMDALSLPSSWIGLGASDAAFALAGAGAGAGPGAGAGLGAKFARFATLPVPGIRDSHDRRSPSLPFANVRTDRWTTLGEDPASTAGGKAVRGGVRDRGGCRVPWAVCRWLRHQPATPVFCCVPSR